jgi:hypothetical protein
MAKPAKKLRKLEFMTIFINEKQKKIKRPPAIEGVSVDEFLRSNADPICLHQHGDWQLIEPELALPSEFLKSET